MSATKRFLSGSLAGWASIAVVLLNQLALVPLFLSHWSVEEYGVWLAVPALLSFSTVFSFGYSTYFEFEFLKMGGKDRADIGKLLYAGLPIVLAMAFTEMLLLIALVLSGAIGNVLAFNLSIPTELIRDAGYLLIVQSINWLVCICVPGMFQRALGPLGYYARNSWMYVLGAATSTLATAVSVSMGASFLETGVIQVLAYSVFAAYFVCDLWKNLAKEQVKPIRPNIALGFKAIFPAIGMAIKILLGMVQQQGIRILLSSSLGLRELASFASMRTISNFALQGIGTVVNPITPELTRFASNQESDKVQGVFSVMWFLTVVLLSFSLIALQVMGPWLFNSWTLGKIVFNPVVFAILSASLLVYGLSQPALAVVRGSNNVHAQLLATICGAAIVAISVFAFSRTWGLIAAATGIFLSELTSFGIYAWSAKKWMLEQNLVWPSSMFRLIGVYAAVGASGILATSMTHRYVVLVVAVVTITQLILTFQLWGTLPPAVVQRIQGVAKRFFPSKFHGRV